MGMALPFHPRPIVTNEQEARILWIQVGSNIGNINSGLEYVDNYPEEEVLNYLSRCKERRTLSLYQNDDLDEITIALSVVEKGRVKHIVLGESSYSYFGYRSMLFDILEAEKVAQNLLEILSESSKRVVEN